MSSTVWLWVWVIIFIGVIIGGYWLYKHGKLGKIRIRLPSIRRKPRLEEIRIWTAVEQDRAKELRDVLEAKKEWARARADNIRLGREIEEVNTKSVEKEKRVAEQEEKEAQEAQKVKPKRL